MKIYEGQNSDRAVLVLAGSDKKLLLEAFSRLLNVVQKITTTSDEPKINVLCTYTDGGWRMMIFLRSKLRPAAFYREDEEKVLISPGTIDMAGVVITPLQLDFNRLDGDQIRAIYREVSLPEKTLEKIIQEL